MTDKIYDNRWKVVNSGKPLGKGGQGITYLVEDLEDENKIYVLKRLKDENRINRFRDEIEAIKKFDHPNIVKYKYSNLETAKPYHVTEYCSGGDLSCFDKASKLSTIEKLKLFSTICKAIGYAHENGVIHRDIKPANILLQADEKTPIITDFGICFNTEEGLERLTESIEQVGARYYMAPEFRDGRADKDKITPRSDVYSLGKVLYWMFRGQVMDRENFDDEEWNLRKQDFSNHSMHFIYEIFEKTIKYNPNDRFLDANELAEEIDKITSIFSNNGRFLDADVPSKCVFCGVGYYSQKTIIPRIHKSPPPFQGQGVQSYQLDYSQFLPQILSGTTIGLPEGNIKQGLYSKYLILTCDHCGNCQLFNVGQEGSQNWKNVEPEIN